MAKTEQSALDWLLEPADPGIRYLALRDLVKADARTISAARKQAHASGPIAQVLAKMQAEGFWEQAGVGYYPKYTGTVWSIILLGQLGASAAVDGKVATACSYLMEHAFRGEGVFTLNGLPSGVVDCLQGNLCEALTELGCEAPRVDKAYEVMARFVTGEGIAPMGDKQAPLRFYAGKCGPNFACGANNKLPCAWGAAKVMLAFSKLPKERRTPVIDRAIGAGVEFLFSRDPAKADYPCGYNARPSGNWWKFGFPVFYVTDILQIAEALVGLGYGGDARLANTLAVIRGKQDAQGRWPLEYDYAGKTWVDFGRKKQPSKWVTLRALRVLAAAH